MNNKIFYSITLGLLMVGFSMKGMQLQLKKAVRSGNIGDVKVLVLEKKAIITDHILKVAPTEEIRGFLLKQRSYQRRPGARQMQRAGVAAGVLGLEVEGAPVERARSETERFDVEAQRKLHEYYKKMKKKGKKE